MAWLAGGAFGYLLLLIGLYESWSTDELCSSRQSALVSAPRCLGGVLHIVLRLRRIERYIEASTVQYLLSEVSSVIDVDVIDERHERGRRHLLCLVLSFHNGSGVCYKKPTKYIRGNRLLHH